VFDYPGGPSTERRAFLDDLHDDEVETVVSHAQVRRYAAGEAAVVRGTLDRSFFIVTSGRFSVTAGHNHAVRSLGRGDIFGERAFFDCLPRSADVVASEPSEVLVMTPAGVDRLRLSEPRLAFLLVMNLGRVVSLDLRRLEAEGIGGTGTAR
jgi:CRP/FNR family cyclic AMP-dependent transcriptional regulator